MKAKDLTVRIQQLLDQSTAVLATQRSNQYHGLLVDEAALSGLKAAVLSFISMVYGVQHSHYAEFNSAAKTNGEVNARRVHAILLCIQNEIEGGWIFSVKKLLTAEIFSDFLEMAEHLLTQGYKDPAAVMIGSVLEENLRQLCADNGVDIETEKDGKRIPKKADLLNADLVKAEVYNKLDQKAVTTWLDLRNSAAHGKYGEYTDDQVKIMLQGVTEFLVRHVQ